MGSSGYNSKVLLPFFEGNNQPLLTLQQQSQDQDFFRLIGEQLGFPIPYQARRGEDYLGALFTAGDKLGY